METVMQDYEVDQIDKEDIPDVVGIEYDFEVIDMLNKKKVEPCNKIRRISCNFAS